MLRNEIETRLHEYAKTHLSPTEAERAEISRRYNQLKSFLKDSTLQNGSYARRTSTTPVNDLDVIYELPSELAESVRIAKSTIDTSKLDIRKIIGSLGSELENLYGSSASIVPQPHSVGVYFGNKDDFSIDVVPALRSEDGLYWVPEVANLSVKHRRNLYESKAFGIGPHWIKSDPRGYIEQARAIDESSGGRFRKCAKIVKKWRQRSKGTHGYYPLKSFHLELLVTDIFLKRPQTSIVEALEQYITGLTQLVSHPHLPDRADRSRLIDSYVDSLSEEDWSCIEESMATCSSNLAAVLASPGGEASDASIQQFLAIESSRRVSKFESLKRLLKGLVPTRGREDREQFLDDFGIATNLQYDMRINAEVTANGSKAFRLRSSNKPLMKRCSLKFFIESCSVPRPFKVKWKVKNTGAEARCSGQLRGQIYKDHGQGIRSEDTLYWGNHYVECYAIKDNVCVAADHIDVCIGNR